LLRQNTAKTAAPAVITADAAGSAASAFHSFSQLVRNISTDENSGFSEYLQSLAAHKLTKRWQEAGSSGRKRPTGRL